MKGETGSGHQVPRMPSGLQKACWDSGGCFWIHTHTRVCVLTELLTDLMMPVNTFCCLALKPLLSGLVFPRILSFTGGLSGIFFFFTETLILFILLGTARECRCDTKFSIQMRLCVWNSPTLLSVRESLHSFRDQQLTPG